MIIAIDKCEKHWFAITIDPPAESVYVNLETSTHGMLYFMLRAYLKKYTGDVTFHIDLRDYPHIVDKVQSSLKTRFPASRIERVEHPELWESAGEWLD